MERLILLLFDIGLCITYTGIAFIIFMTIQLICYRIFKFNLYKWLSYNILENWL